MDKATKREIDAIAWRTLRDAGTTEAPVRVEALLGHLRLNRSYYDLQNPGFLDRAKHRVKIGAQKMSRIMKKIRLQAVLFFGENRIIIDESLPDLKREWPAFHESSHQILPWHHASFDYGDTAQTLDPDWQELLEEEANYCASTLMFCGPRFTSDAQDTRPEWASIKALKQKYGKTITSTLRRYVTCGPNHPMAMLVSTPSWMVTGEDRADRCRHFVKSTAFSTRYASVKAAELLQLVDDHASVRRGGLVADFTFGIEDNQGRLHEFRAETFFNRYDLLTLVVEWRRMVESGLVVPTRFGGLGQLRTDD